MDEKMAKVAIALEREMEALAHDGLSIKLARAAIEAMCEEDERLRQELVEWKQAAEEEARQRRARTCFC